MLGLLIALIRWRWTDRVTRALVVGVLVMLVLGAASPLMIPLGGAHEVAIVLPFGAVLGGRVIGPWLAVRRQPGGPAEGPLGHPVSAGRPADGGLRARRRRARLLVGPRLRRRAAVGPSRYQDLADWLAAHGLTSGLSLATGPRTSTRLRPAAGSAWRR